MTLRSKKILYICLLCLTLCFIWGNSMLSQTASGALSKLVASILGVGGGDGGEGHFWVRKLAHFTEFAVLGVFSVLLWGCYEYSRRERAAFCVATGLFVPLVDETIQIFSGRGPSLRDVWIDVGGFCFGCLCVMFLTCLFARRSRIGEKEGSQDGQID